ncbi:hypothetical protein ACFPH6_10330 [Streptomyces xiangluensis]|uniref:Sulfatase N-terminal domain-containing protein n=1 Tax=Streptomyces xiangluensis TaxID=2665720 RepID=A0ABV8YM20_9ACTN
MTSVIYGMVADGWWPMGFVRETGMPPPNVLVFLTDQQRWDTTGIHGNRS